MYAMFQNKNGLHGKTTDDDSPIPMDMLDDAPPAVQLSGCCFAVNTEMNTGFNEHVYHHYYRYTIYGRETIIRSARGYPNGTLPTGDSRSFEFKVRRGGTVNRRNRPVSLKRLYPRPFTVRFFVR